MSDPTLKGCLKRHSMLGFRVSGHNGSGVFHTCCPGNPWERESQPSRLIRVPPWIFSPMLVLRSLVKPWQGCSSGLHSHSLRLVLWCITCEKKMAVNLMGPVCSSWGVPNRGTSMRSFINAQGQEGFASVSSANKMISRTLATSICVCVSVCASYLYHGA